MAPKKEATLSQQQTQQPIMDLERIKRHFSWSDPSAMWVTAITDGLTGPLMVHKLVVKSRDVVETELNHLPIIIWSSLPKSSDFSTSDNNK